MPDRPNLSPDVIQGVNATMKTMHDEVIGERFFAPLIESVVIWEGEEPPVNVPDEAQTLEAAPLPAQPITQDQAGLLQAEADFIQVEADCAPQAEVAAVNEACETYDADC